MQERTVWLARLGRAALVMLSLGAMAVFGQAQVEAPFQALQPEIQTAEWAQEWWMPRHEAKLREKSERERIDLVMIGDSITHGWETAGKTVWDEYYGSRNAFNLGFSGDRTEQVLWRLEQGEVDGIAPKAVVLMIGTNNTGHRQDPPEETAAGIRAIIQQLRQRLPAAKILLLAIFPRGADTDDDLRELNDRVNLAIQELANQQSVFYLDVGDAFLEKDGTLPRSIMPDLLHPNENGYRIWAEAMEPMLRQLLGER